MQGCLYVRQANTTIHEAIHRIAGFGGVICLLYIPRAKFPSVKSLSKEKRPLLGQGDRAG